MSKRALPLLTGGLNELTRSDLIEDSQLQQCDNYEVVGDGTLRKRKDTSVFDSKLDNALFGTQDEILNPKFKAAATEGAMAAVLDYNELPLVSIDFNHNPASSVFDSTQTKVDGKLVKVMAWYDNEWGFSNRMIDQVKALGQYL